MQKSGGGGDISYVVPTKLKSGGGGGTRPPVPHRSTPMTPLHVCMTD